MVLYPESKVREHAPGAMRGRTAKLQDETRYTTHGQHKSSSVGHAGRGRAQELGAWHSPRLSKDPEAMQESCGRHMGDKIVSYGLLRMQDTPAIGAPDCPSFSRAIVLEGSWQKAKGLLMRHPKLQGLKRVQLPGDVRTVYW